MYKKVQKYKMIYQFTQHQDLPVQGKQGYALHTMQLS